jgi:Secretion system C-terminal sorting domain
MQKTSLKTLLLIASLIVIPEKSHAQWVQTNGPYGGEINALAISGETVFAGTNGSGAFCSTNKGTNWVGLRGGLPSGQVSSFAIQGENIFASTASGVFLSTDKGVSWNDVSNELPLQFGINYFAVIGMNVFAATMDSGIFLSTNSGAKWKSVNTGLENLYVQSLIASGTNLYAGTGNGVYLSTNNGSNWTRLGAPTISDFRAMLVVGTNIFAGGYGIYLSTNNGASWTTGGLTRHYIYAFISNPNTSGGTNIFAGTDTGVVLSTDNGTSWKILNTGLTNIYVNALAMSGNNLFAGTEDGVFLSTNNGALWSQVSTGMTGVGVNALITISDGSGGKILFTGTEGGTYFSTDNGSHWSHSGQLNEYIYSLAYDGNDIFAATGLGTYVSSNKGASWISTFEGTSNAFTFLDNKVFAATESGVYISTNEGTTWSRADSGLSLGTSTDVSAITVCDTIIIIGCYGGSTVEYSWWVILGSTDKGLSWADADSGLSGDYVNVLSTHGQNILAGTSHNGIYRSTNYGRTWTQVNTGLNPVEVLSFAINDSNIFASSEGGVFLSTNEGGQWRQNNSGLLDTNVSSLVVNGDNLFAGTQDRGVWRRPLSEMTPVKGSKPALPIKFSLLQNYPNPFNPTTAISYSLPMNALVTLKIYDILGRDVKTLVNERQDEGSHSVIFNAKDLSSGVYFYRLTAGSFIGTKKLMLIK